MLCVLLALLCCAFALFLCGWSVSVSDGSVGLSCPDGSRSAAITAVRESPPVACLNPPRHDLTSRQGANSIHNPKQAEHLGSISGSASITPDLGRRQSATPNRPVSPSRRTTSPGLRRIDRYTQTRSRSFHTRHLEFPSSSRQALLHSRTFFPPCPHFLRSGTRISIKVFTFELLDSFFTLHHFEVHPSCTSWTIAACWSPYQTDLFRGDIPYIMQTKVPCFLDHDGSRHRGNFYEKLKLPFHPDQHSELRGLQRSLVIGAPNAVGNLSSIRYIRRRVLRTGKFFCTFLTTVRTPPRMQEGVPPHPEVRDEWSDWPFTSPSHSTSGLEPKVQLAFTKAWPLDCCPGIGRPNTTRRQGTRFHSSGNS